MSEDNKHVTTSPKVRFREIEQGNYVELYCTVVE